MNVVVFVVVNVVVVVVVNVVNVANVWRRHIAKAPWLPATTEWSETHVPSLRPRSAFCASPF